jgi:hypothetical protein
MARLPFEQLSDSNAFVSLCSDLLEAEGFRNVRGRGRGPDQGVDLLAEVPVVCPVEDRWAPILIQCKHYAVGTSVGDKDMSSLLTAIPQQKTEWLHIITSGYLSGTAVSKANAHNGQPTSSRVTWWDGEELSKRLRRYPWLIERHFVSATSRRPEQSEGDSLASPTEYDLDELLQEYAVAPRYAELEVDSFPVTDDNQTNAEAIREYVERFRSEPPRVTVLKGGVGAGKSGLSGALAGELEAQGADVAYVSEPEFLEQFVRHYLQEDPQFLAVYAFWSQVDVLILDDVGLDIRDRSDAQAAAAQAMIKLIKTRVAADRTTFITAYPQNVPVTTLEKYVAHVAAKFEGLDLGTESLRQLCDPWWGEVPPVPAVANAGPDSPAVMCYLGKGWLLEKLRHLRRLLDVMRKELLVPEDEYEGQMAEAEALSGESLSREESLMRRIAQGHARIHTWEEFIEGLPFRHIAFMSDGSAELEAVEGPPGH